MEARIVLKYDDANVATAVAKAVSPDNFKTPRDLIINTTNEAKEVITQIECRGKLPTFIATIDDLLFCVSIAEKVLQTTKKLR